MSAPSDRLPMGDDAQRVVAAWRDLGAVWCDYSAHPTGPETRDEWQPWRTRLVIVASDGRHLYDREVTVAGKAASRDAALAVAEVALAEIARRSVEP